MGAGGVAHILLGHRFYLQHSQKIRFVFEIWKDPVVSVGRAIILLE
jgi:hypothetical protein